jgi:hypothetical protein
MWGHVVGRRKVSSEIVQFRNRCQKIKARKAEVAKRITIVSHGVHMEFSRTPIR